MTFQLTDFINSYITHRETSFFQDDVEKKTDSLYDNISGNSVIVIGGAGSIGSSFIRAILRFHPGELCVVDTNENALTELTRALRSDSILSSNMPKIWLSYPMDYNSDVFRRMFRSHLRTDGKIGFDYVANFSAHKHVRSEKDIYSVEALFSNNVIHAKSFLDFLSEYPPKAYFCVSTDKAANPVNLMGASKRIMEDMIFSYSDRFPVKTARFANVAFSNGSLPDGFLHRLALHQPLSAPSDVRRYFVSPEESGQICMLAAFLGENREIFFPKLEEASMKSFDEIAVELLHEYGYEPAYYDSDEAAIKAASLMEEGSRLYPVHFSKSDTSGEKEYEEFYTEGETVDMVRFSSLGVITGKPVPNREKVTELIALLDKTFDKDNAKKEDIVTIVSDYLPDFRHIETGKSLDEKM